MSFRNRPTLDRRHRPRWQDELRSQQLIVAGFAVAIAIAIGIFGATTWSAYYDSHLRQVAFIGGLSLDRDALDKRTGIITAELNAKGNDLLASTGGAHNNVIQQQLQVIQQTLQSVDTTASESLTTGALMRQESSKLGIALSDSALAKEVSRRTTLPFQLQLSIITVNALSATPAANAKPTTAQWAAAERQANALLAQLRGGANFGTLAKQKTSDPATKAFNGLVGWVQEGDSVYGTFFSAAKGKRAGDLVGPVKGDVGYAIVKVDNMRAATPDGTLKSLLSAVHASDADYREYVRDALLKGAFQDYFGQKVLSRYMPQQHVAQIQIQPDTGAPIPKERVRHVLIQPIPGADDQTKATTAQWAAALAEAKAVRALLAKPTASWKTVAKEHSDDPGSRDYGGDLGWYDPTTAQVVPEFKAAIQKLGLNQVSQPVKTQFGYHVIEIFGRRINATEQATNIENELKKNPASFAAVAARESVDHQSADKGGDIGWVASYEKDPALETAIFGLTKVGQISHPVPTAGGIYIFRLLETSAARYVEPDRLSTIKSTGYSRWQDQLKTKVGEYWVDPAFQSTTASG